MICLAVRRARGIRSQGRAKRAASSGDRVAVILEFEFLSRIIASKPSMACWRWPQRQSHICLNQDRTGRPLAPPPAALGDRRPFRLSASRQRRAKATSIGSLLAARE
jgi:hypothetical protein